MIAISLPAALGTVHAASPYDGSWQVTITTVRGACSSGGWFRLQIHNWVVHGGGSGVAELPAGSRGTGLCK